jgi:hypothetical protein|tara:strand:+ start:242 stop:367 length:126 start_codon:yes stop_codon:yes gene_type:complete
VISFIDLSIAPQRENGEQAREQRPSIWTAYERGDLRRTLSS